MDEIKLLTARFEAKKAARSNWDDIWEEIALYSMPGKADFITDRSTGDKSRSLEIYDPTAAVSNHTLASHMHSSMTNPASKWFEQKFKGEGYNTKEANVWIEECTERMFESINDSNFVSIINELYQNLTAFGTACIEVTYVNDPLDGFKLVFRDIDLASLIFMENIHGRVDTVFHEMKVTVRQAKQLFGNNSPEKINKLLEKQPDKECKILRCVRPNPKYDPNKPLDEKSRAFESIYIYEGMEIIRQGFFELPFMVPRWSKMTTEPYGYGPGLLALPDIKTLNEAKRLELRGWEKAIDPPLWGMAGAVVGNLHLEASGFTKVRDRNAIGMINQGTSWQATQVKSQEIRNNIQSVYLIDQLILPERPNATATEVQIRYEMMQKVLGPTMGRLEAELLNPMVNRIFNILLRNGQLPEIPEELQGAETEVRYTGPLARAQTSEEAVAVERLMNFIMGTAQLDPSVMDVIDMRKAVRAVSDQWGVPAEVMRSQDEVDEIDAQRAEQMQEQKAKEDEMQSMQMEEQAAQTSTANVEAMRNVAGQY
jgi:hypothetical protein